MKRIPIWLSRCAMFLLAWGLLSYVVTGVVTKKPHIAGFRLMYVPTDSMEDTIPAHSWVIVTPVDPEDVLIGDIVTYRRSARWNPYPAIKIHLTVIHRVIGKEGDLFLLQGDNEALPDPSVNAEQIGYRVVWILS